MKVHKWLGNRYSAIIGQAIIELDEGEEMDEENTQRAIELIDGKGMPNFGYRVEHVGERLDEPLYKVSVYRD